MTKEHFDACIGALMVLGLIAVLVGAFGWEFVLYLTGGFVVAGAGLWLRSTLPD